MQNDGAAKHRVEASYLARSLAWNSDYVLTVARDDKTADLNGWVTLTNNSGTAFKNARLQLVAGDLNRVRQQLGKMADVAAAPRMQMAEERMAQESFSDYHLYSVARKTTINNSQTKQVSMFDGTDVPVVKRYVVEGQRHYYHNQMHPGSPLKDSVQVFYQFKNEAKAGLGIPMPAGVLRVYQQDSKGGTQFVGEDRIMHTPKDETLNVKIGNAFDVICERNQTGFQKIATNVYDVDYEITLRNHKSTAIEVEVNEPIGGTWRMLNSSHQWTKTSAWAAQFKVPVAADAHRGAEVPRARHLLTGCRAEAVANADKNGNARAMLASGVSVLPFSFLQLTRDYFSVWPSVVRRSGAVVVRWTLHKATSNTFLITPCRAGVKLRRDDWDVCAYKKDGRGAPRGQCVHVGG